MVSIDFKLNSSEIELLLLIKMVETRLNRAFDISECSYDRYPRKDVKRAEKELEELSKVKTILVDLFKENN